MNKLIESVNKSKILNFFDTGPVNMFVNGLQIEFKYICKPTQTVSHLFKFFITSR